MLLTDLMVEGRKQAVEPDVRRRLPQDDTEGDPAARQHCER